MKTIKQLGVFMDHSNAFLMELTNGEIDTSNIESDNTLEVERINADTHIIEGREEHQLQSAYYKKISDIILNYQEVLLFGPTDAKNELYNLIKENPLFKNIKIELRNTDKMTDNQVHAYVLDFFK